ncbi:hypothetical protein BX600DRAFT_510713 [Xylariales sp. PMI_506]|nr:hypothetical protein BX600DRAFT_510713 [Xylariales sp. PMI_506]
MLVPTVANYVTQFYAIGNTPAVSITRSHPQGVDADILLLGCGDVRNILFTCYSEKGFPSRKLDFTCCDTEAAVISRNAFLLSLLLEGESQIDHNTAWSIYYDLYLTDASASLVRAHAQRLLDASASLDDWRQCPFSTVLRFCDAISLQLARDFWSKMATTKAKSTFDKELQNSRDQQVLKMGEKDSVVMTGCRSAAPLSRAALSEVGKSHHQYWQPGSGDGRQPGVPNPLFSSALNQNTLLHYGTDPVLGYHLVTAFANLAPTSPLLPTPSGAGGTTQMVDAAKTQFKEWIAAFRTLKSTLRVRFIIADAFSFSHVLQSNFNEDISANVYRRQWDMSTCDLDAREYGPTTQAPRKFDIIDTSNLADHFGTLNLLVATRPLLKDLVSSTLCIETLIRTEGSRKAQFDALLCGHGPTMSLLLGLTPIEYFTNATSVSSVDELIMNAVLQKDQAQQQTHTRLSWKLNDLLINPNKAAAPLRAEPAVIASTLFGVYLKMFEHENPFGLLDLPKPKMEQKMRNSAYTPFHRGSFVALVKSISMVVDSDWPSICQTLIDMISQDKMLMLGNQYAQEFGLQLHLQGLYTERLLRDPVLPQPSLKGFNAWQAIPEAVVVTLVVPHERLDRLFTTASSKLNAPTLQGVLRSSRPDPHGWQNMFMDTHIAFGHVKTSNRSEDDSYAVLVQEDSQGWRGSSPLVISFYVPSAALQVEPTTCLVGLAIKTTAHSLVTFKHADLGPNLIVYETTITDGSHVFVTKSLPGTTGRPITLQSSPSTTARYSSNTENPVSIRVDIDKATGNVESLTGHVDIVTEIGKKLLTEKVTISLQQTSPFTIDIVFGKESLVLPVCFPLPILKETSKTRIARTSGYIEVVAPVADPLDAEPLSDFIFPLAFGPNSAPVVLNGHHLNLDTLPILDVEPQYKKDNQWLTTLTSHQFSVRERRIRDSDQAQGTASENLRINLKESLFTLFMLASGLQGGQTGGFALQHPKQGNVILIFVQSVRIDASAASAVLDAAILPLTRELIDSGKLETFLLVLRELQMCVINVDDDELHLWKRMIPFLVERSRTWHHGEGCEYRRPGATIPLSFGAGDRLLCSCGDGKLPDGFTRLPEWDVAARHAVRAAISPVFSVPFVEDTIDAEMLRAGGLLGAKEETCRNCGKTKEMNGGKLLQCSRCKEVSYCDRNCQKADWKKHRMECSSE